METEIYLVRRRGSEYIHTSTCRHATADGLRWSWADQNPTIDWRLHAPWLKPCRRCNPPSPLHSIKVEEITTQGDDDD